MKSNLTIFYGEKFFMCVLYFFDTDTGEELKNPPQGKSVVAVGRLLFPGKQQESETHEGEIPLEVASVADDGYNLEIISDREVRGTFEEVRNAIQELGFTLLDWVYQRMFENIWTCLGLSKEKKST